MVAQGWKPQGGICVTIMPGFTNPRPFYHQAMIKEG